MPKVRTVRSLSRSSPYSRPPVVDHRKEWEEVRCPICMEHPHNAVLLKCSSHNTGCRPYMCDTSRRHSNCLDQFLKISSTGPAWAASPCRSHGEPGPACPLCRGSILGYSASGPARDHLDSEPRSCSTEGCRFSGSYSELRRHARSDHPSARPTEVDPTRRLDWARLERVSNNQDVLSLDQTSRLLGDDDEGDNHVSPRRQPGSLTSFVASIFNFTSFFHRSMEMLHVSRMSDSYLEGGDQLHSSSLSPSPSPSPAPRHGAEQEQEEETVCITPTITSSSGTGRSSNFLEGNFRPASQLRWRRRSYHDTFTAHRRRSYHRSGGPARWAEPPPQRTPHWSQRWSSYEHRQLLI